MQCEGDQVENRTGDKSGAEPEAEGGEGCDEGRSLAEEQVDRGGNGEDPRERNAPRYALGWPFPGQVLEDLSQHGGDDVP